MGEKIIKIFLISISLIMECCNICFYEYNSDSRTKKDLTCGHCLCYECYLMLHKNSCPYCRSDIFYTIEEQKERLSYQPPSNIYNNYITSTISDILENIPIPTNLPFSGVIRQMNRRRRRKLSFDEVIQRRKMIKKRCKAKWMKRYGRQAKEFCDLNTDNNFNFGNI